MKSQPSWLALRKYTLVVSLPIDPIDSQGAHTVNRYRHKYDKRHHLSLTNLMCELSLPADVRLVPAFFLLFFRFSCFWFFSYE